MKHDKLVGPLDCRAEIYADCVASCPLASHGEYANETDGRTPDRCIMLFAVDAANVKIFTAPSLVVDVLCRIRTERNGGAWCPKQQISRDVYEWLEVDLGQLKVVTQVETQGRFGNGQVRRMNVIIDRSEI